MRARVERGGERYWRYSDFPAQSPAAAVQALLRLERAGVLRKVRKGLYYRGRETAFGASVPSGADVAALSLRAPLQPAGLTAANALGLTTQNPARPEYATSWHNAPTSVPGAIVHTRRPASRARLTAQEGALLEFLRERGRTSDLRPDATIRRLQDLLRAGSTFERVAGAALDEPPRVRAMLGALGQELNAKEATLSRLRRSLNPLSRFDFGVLSALGNAKEWQAR